MSNGVTAQSTYSFKLDVEPLAKKRVRVYATRSGVRGVNPSRKDEDYYRSAISKLGSMIPRTPLEESMLLGMKFYKSIPKSTRKRDYKEVVTEHLRPAKRPDLDNYIKLFKDAGTDLLWKDDNIIVGYLPGTGKYYTLGSPYIIVDIIIIDENFRENYLNYLSLEISRVKKNYTTLDLFDL